MRKLHLTDINLLSEITPEDEIFVSKISDEYNISIDELRWLIRDLRDEIQDNITEVREPYGDFYKRYSEKLFAPDVEIQGISIKTNKGAIEIKASDPFFYYFANRIQNLKFAFDKHENNSNKKLNKLAKSLPFNKIIIYFFDTLNIPYQRNIAIGMFLAHFDFGIKTEPDWNKMKKSPGDDYKHYLSATVSSRLKKYYKDSYFINY